MHRVLRCFFNIPSGDEELTALEVINIPLNVGSGSGVSMVPDDTIISMPTSGADITAFKNITEESIGQLYTYYYSKTSVVLGTRSATSSDGTIQMAVGVSAVANDMYVCIVENFVNATSRIDVDIRTLTSE